MEHFPQLIAPLISRAAHAKYACITHPMSHPQPMRIVDHPPCAHAYPPFHFHARRSPRVKVTFLFPLLSKKESPSLLYKILKIRYIYFKGNSAYTYLCFASVALLRKAVPLRLVSAAKSDCDVMAETTKQTTHESVSAVFDVPLQIERYVHFKTILLNTFFELSRGQYRELLWTSNTYKTS